jgi:hypothetical protein
MMPATVPVTSGMGLAFRINEPDTQLADNDGELELSLLVERKPSRKGPTRPDVQQESAEAAPTGGRPPQGGAKTSDSNLRTWTDKTGNFTTKAEFVDVSDGKVTLRKPDGTPLVVSLEKLSEEDQEWIRKQPLAGSKQGAQSSKSTLAGTWKASTGALFRIADDGKTVTIELISSNVVQSLSGELVRQADQSNPLLRGTFEVFLANDARKKPSVVRVTAAIVDSSTLNLECKGWPQRDHRGLIAPMKGVLKEVLTRSGNPVLVPGGTPSASAGPGAPPPGFRPSPPGGEKPGAPGSSGYVPRPPGGAPPSP